jgi:uncharacterized membrane protein
MKQISWKMLRNLGFGMLTVLLISSISISILTYAHRDSHFSNPLLMFAINNHIIIMIVLAIVSVLFGFVWAGISYSEIEKKTKESRDMLNVVLQFLSKEERDIINLVIEKKGDTTQAEVSRLQNMDRVKAYRSLQKMQAKGLIDIEPHGKVRKIRLKENILDVFLEKKE